MKRLGKLHAGRLGHMDIQEEHIRPTVVSRILLVAHQQLHGLTRVGGLLDGIHTPRLLEEKAQLGARWSLVINYQCVKHAEPTIPAQRPVA